MNIFEKRPLALVLCIGLGGFFLFTFDNPLIRLILIASAFLPLIISLILRQMLLMQATLGGATTLAALCEGKSVMSCM